MVGHAGVPFSQRGRGGARWGPPCGTHECTRGTAARPPRLTAGPPPALSRPSPLGTRARAPGRPRVPPARAPGRPVFLRGAAARPFRGRDDTPRGRSAALCGAARALSGRPALAPSWPVTLGRACGPAHPPDSPPGGAPAPPILRGGPPRAARGAHPPGPAVQKWAAGDPPARAGPPTRGAARPWTWLGRVHWFAESRLPRAPGTAPTSASSSCARHGAHGACTCPRTLPDEPLWAALGGGAGTQRVRRHDHTPGRRGRVPQGAGQCAQPHSVARALFLYAVEPPSCTRRPTEFGRPGAPWRGVGGPKWHAGCPAATLSRPPT